MENAKHTAGPWDRVDISTGSATKREQLNYRGYAAMQIQHDGSDEGEANAKLIAASPDLVEALRRAVNHLIMDIDRDGKGIHSHDTPEALAQARAALLKAGITSSTPARA